jgi:RNA polymerase sigma factor (sigma-70 family)
MTRDELVRANLPLAYFWARRCARHPAARRLCLDYEDLVQEFSLALTRAADSFDPAKGAFGTFAWWKMRGCWSQLRHAAGRRVQTQAAREEDPAARPDAAPVDLSPLPPRGRLLLGMRLEGYTFEEAGRAAGLTRQAAREAVLRAGREVLCD